MEVNQFTEQDILKEIVENIGKMSIRKVIILLKDFNHFVLESQNQHSTLIYYIKHVWGIKQRYNRLLISLKKEVYKSNWLRKAICNKNQAKKEEYQRTWKLYGDEHLYNLKYCLSNVKRRKHTLENNLNRKFILPYSMLSSPPKRPSLCQTRREGLDKGDFYFPQIYIF